MFILLCTFRLRKKDDDHIYETPDTKTAPPLPPRIEQNVSYGVSPQTSLHMTINTAYDTNEQSVAYDVSPQHGLHMTINTAYDTSS